MASLLQDLQEQLVKSEALNGPDNPHVKGLKQQIADMESRKPSNPSTQHFHGGTFDKEVKSPPVIEFTIPPQPEQPPRKMMSPEATDIMLAELAECFRMYARGEFRTPAKGDADSPFVKESRKQIDSLEKSKLQPQAPGVEHFSGGMRGPPVEPKEQASSHEYFTWRSTQQTCKKCGWTGLGKDTASETFHHGSEESCPVCDYYFGFVPFSPYYPESE